MERFSLTHLTSFILPWSHDTWGNIQDNIAVAVILQIITHYLFFAMLFTH